MVESVGGQQGRKESVESLPGQEDIFSFLQSTDELEVIAEPVAIQLATPPAEDQADDEPGFLQTVDGQLSFVDSDEWWKEHWVGMPEFIQEDASPWKSMYIHFRNREDLKEFSEIITQRLTADTPSIWYPEMPKEKRMHMGYVDES